MSDPNGSGPRDAVSPVSVPEFTLRFSRLASNAACNLYLSDLEEVNAYKKQNATVADRPGSESSMAMLGLDAAALRSRADENIILPRLAKQEARWPGDISIEPRIVAGVHTEVFTPKS